MTPPTLPERYDTYGAIDAEAITDATNAEPFEMVNGSTNGGESFIVNDRGLRFARTDAEGAFLVLESFAFEELAGYAAETLASIGYDARYVDVFGRYDADEPFAVAIEVAP